MDDFAAGAADGGGGGRFQRRNDHKSVHPRLRRDPREVDAALVVAEDGVQVDRAVAQLHAAVDPGEGMDPPVLVVAVGMVLVGVGAPRFLAGLG